MNYYYLMASMPRLILGVPSPISLPEFLERCSEHLTEPDLAVLADTLETGGEGSRHPFIAEWVRRDGLLRNAVVRQRATRLGKEAPRHLREDGAEASDVERLVAGVFSHGDPLDREMELDRLRWQILEDLAGFNHFSLSALLAYGLQLKLVERWAAMKAERGAQVVEELANR
jgi:hypothetical protein